LAEDAMQSLRDAELVSYAQCFNTATAYDIHTAKTLQEYAQRQEAFWDGKGNAAVRREQLLEMAAAFGEGDEVVNVFTGRRHTL